MRSFCRQGPMEQRTHPHPHARTHTRTQIWSFDPAMRGQWHDIDERLIVSSHMSQAHDPRRHITLARAAAHTCTRAHTSARQLTYMPAHVLVHARTLAHAVTHAVVHSGMHAIVHSGMHAVMHARTHCSYALCTQLRTHA